VFDLDNFGLSIIPSVKQILSSISEHLSKCLNMLANPEYPEEFTKELKLQSKLLSITSEILSAIQTVQNRLIKFSPIFKFRELERFLTNKETMSQFLKLREEFMSIIKQIEEHEMKFFIQLVRSEDEENKIEGLIQKLDLLKEMAENIGSSLSVFFKMIRIQCPRYFYCTDEQMLTFCSLLKFPRVCLLYI
jgi:hypothetical protein